MINAVLVNTSDRCRAVVQHTNMLPAGVTVLCVEGLEAGAAVGPPLLHDIALTPQHRLTLEAAEVLHVPVTSLCLGALIRKDDLRKEGERERGRGHRLSQVHRGKNLNWVITVR